MNKIHIKDRQVFLISLDKETKEQLQKETEQKGLNLSAYIREIIRKRK